MIALAGMAATTSLGIIGVTATAVFVLMLTVRGLRWVEEQPGGIAAVLFGAQDKTPDDQLAEWHRQEAERIAATRQALPHTARERRDALLKDIDTHHNAARQLEGRGRHARGK